MSKKKSIFYAQVIHVEAKWQKDGQKSTSEMSGI